MILSPCLSTTPLSICYIHYNKFHVISQALNFVQKIHFLYETQFLRFSLSSLIALLNQQNILYDSILNAIKTILVIALGLP